MYFQQSDDGRGNETKYQILTEKKPLVSYSWVICVSLVLGLAIFSTKMNSLSRASTNFETTSEVSLTMTAFNEYGNVKSKMFPYPFLEDSLLIEPFKNTTISVGTSRQGCSYDWSIVASAPPSVSVSGISTDVNFTISLETVVAGTQLP